MGTSTKWPCKLVLDFTSGKFYHLAYYNIPATFQRLMHTILDSALHTYVIVYLDGIFIFSKNEENHLVHLQYILQKLRDHKLKAKLSKCSFGMSCEEYLQHMTENGTFKVDPSKVSAIADWPIRKNIQQQ